MSDNPAQEVLDNEADQVVDDSSVVVNKDVAPEKPAGNWYDTLDADLKSNPSVNKFKSPAELAKSYINLEKTLGKNKIVVPTEKSTPEEWKAFYKTVGAPDKEDAYDVSMDEMPEQARINPEALAGLRKAALENGVSKKQFDAMFKSQKEFFNNRLNQEIERLSNLKSEAETSLRSEYGAAYEGKIQGAQKVIDTFFGEGLPPEFKVLANSKQFIKAMANIADKLGEDTLVGRERSTMTPNEAQAEINRILGDRKGPLFDDLHPEHQAYLEKMDRLYRMAHVD